MSPHFYKAVTLCVVIVSLSGHRVKRDVSDGCQGADGRHHEDKEVFKVGCFKYRCVHGHAALERGGCPNPLSSADCLDMGETYQKDCSIYTCVMEHDDHFIRITTPRCNVSNECVNVDTITYCNECLTDANGHPVLNKACRVEDTCYSLGSVIREDCVDKKCVELPTGAEFQEIPSQPERCMLNQDGSCLDVGTTHDCLTCNADLTITTACEFHDPVDGIKCVPNGQTSLHLSEGKKHRCECGVLPDHTSIMHCSEPIKD
ncbi:uncharacterized protein [Haliotis cracherodii]|uniref:uncharacterized protein n=1 Tax=Haliotis cracherodii TaxID=6455 RepID=UPI0039E9C618